MNERAVMHLNLNDESVIELVEGGAQTPANNASQVNDASMDPQLNQGLGDIQNDFTDVLSGLTTSPARTLKGESVPAGQLLDFSFANLAW